MRFEQTSEKKFNRRVNATNAICTSELGISRYANYYANDGQQLVARIDQTLSVFEIVVSEDKSPETK